MINGLDVNSCVKIANKYQGLSGDYNFMIYINNYIFADTNQKSKYNLKASKVCVNAKNEGNINLEITF